MESSTGTAPAAFLLSISSILSLQASQRKVTKTTKDIMHLRLIFTGPAVTLAFLGSIISLNQS